MMRLNLKRVSRRLAAAGLMSALAIGCQTWVPEAGLTLPSGHYLRHPPQYIPPSPPFPLSKELHSLEEAHQQQQQQQGFGGAGGP